MDQVTKEEILRGGVLGSIYAPLQVSRWVIFRKLTWWERVRALFFGRLLVTETYSVDKPEELRYEAMVW